MNSLQLTNFGAPVNVHTDGLQYHVLASLQGLAPMPRSLRAHGKRNCKCIRQANNVRSAWKSTLTIVSVCAVPKIRKSSFQELSTVRSMFDTR
jgi:hypothetical protein